MVDFAIAPAHDPAPNAVTATPTPTLAPPVTIDAGDALVMLVKSLEPAAEAAASAGVQLAAGMVPGGEFILMIFGKNMVNQVVASCAVKLEAVIKANAHLTIQPHNTLEAMALDTIKSEFGPVVGLLSGKLPGWISEAVAKIPGLGHPTGA